VIFHGVLWRGYHQLEGRKVGAVAGGMNEINLLRGRVGRKGGGK